MPSKPVESLAIAGFRGILAPLKLSFKRGGGRASMVLYGNNGTGKSSLTDALEWLQTGTIARLAREGAGPRSYANRSASEKPYVRAMVRDPYLGEVGLEYDPTRVTIPVPIGRLDDLRLAAPHPWHIRSEDLARFVILTKAERFDVLAVLMGFLPQVRFQKQLRRVAATIAAERDQARGRVRDAEARLVHLVGDAHQSASGIVEVINNAVRPLGRSISAFGEAQTLRDDLGLQIAEDPRASRLAALRAFISASTRTIDATAMLDVSERLVQALDDLRVESTATADLARIDLLETGLKLLQSGRAGAPSESCPLCGQAYDGDLKQHIEEELHRLSRLRALQRLVRQKQGQGAEEVSRLTGLVLDVAEQSEAAGKLGLDREYQPVGAAAGAVTKDLEAARPFFDRPPSEWSAADIDHLRGLIESTRNTLDTVSRFQELLATAAHAIEHELEDDSMRTAMVSARDLVRDVIEGVEAVSAREREATTVADTSIALDEIVNDYVAASIDDVDERFTAISNDVERYFSILEETTPGIRCPALRLIKDQDRAVVLEIEFRGDVIGHAYGYLSQSQLNSFGLAVFLASAKLMNSAFPFLVLDDVINSFDAYKRPRLAQLLKEEFDDFQLVVLTHDQVWWDRLARECPDWIKVRFQRYELGSGPVCAHGVSSLDEISVFIANDRPELAGRSLGPVMELELQEMAEAFGAMVQFNRRNEYTLDPLLDRVRIRTTEKLGTSHRLHKLLSEMQEATSFRNFSAHWKNPESPLSSEEMRDVYDRWIAIRGLVRCTGRRCQAVAAYDRATRSFRCPCGACTLAPSQP